MAHKEEEIKQQLPIAAIQHYRLLQQQRRATATATTTTTTLTHLQKTDMNTTMSRGNLEERVGSVQDRHVVQEEEVEEEEEMKMEYMEGTGNIGNESIENVSSGAISGEISGIQKRRHASFNSAQASGASTQKKTPNIAQSGSIGLVKDSKQAGLAKGVANDSKQAKTQHLTACGLIETINSRATNILAKKCVYCNCRVILTFILFHH
jgi:hypothetical protein